MLNGRCFLSMHRAGDADDSSTLAVMQVEIVQIQVSCNCFVMFDPV